MSEPLPYKITMIGGNCPVQAKGAVNGRAFYFRARGEHWSMEIGDDPPNFNVENWYYDEEYPGSKYDAGWMEEEEALALIKKAIGFYSNHVAATKEAGDD